MNRPQRAKDEWLRATIEGLLSADELSQLASAPVESLWSAAVDRGFVTDDELAAAVGVRFRLKVANLDQVSSQAVEAMPEALARRYGVIPLAVTETSIDVATADPLDLDCEQTLAFALGRTVRMAVAPPAAIARKLEELYRPREVIQQLVDTMRGTIEIEAIDESAEEDSIDVIANQAGDRPVIRLVDRVIAEAVASRASDIHLEPEETGVAVRYRIDGVLRQVMVLPKAVKVPIVSRVKIMAQLDIAERLRPQDGRARVAVKGHRVDLRVSTLPASQGEKVVIRILDQSNTILNLEVLGLLDTELRELTALMDAREGMVLVTGPTGSGKTTTLYSMLQTIKERGVNIITVEDPVEYRLPGIVQVQVNEKAGLTFPAALRSILRQDPDVILVGEIRDRETAQIAVQAALTGHVVLSTLHTNDAAASVTRLTDIGVEAYKISAALKGIVAQRLLRRLCTLCKEPARPDEIPERLQGYFPPEVQLYRAVGCPECTMTGYRGRHAVHEMLTVNEDLQARIAAGEPVDQLIEAARAAGMRSLWDSGVEHAKRGDTTIAELLRVLEAPSEERAKARTTTAQPPLRETGHVAIPVAPLPPAIDRGLPAASHQEPAPATGKAPPPRRTLRMPPEKISLNRPTTTQTATGSFVTPVTAPVAIEHVWDRAMDPPSASGPTGARRNGALHDPPSAKPRTSRFEGPPPRVLLVEDEEPLRRVMKDLLERDGFVIFEAGDGIQAVDQVDRLKPDALVLDLNLPRLDGFGVLKHLRARAETQRLPVIVLTAKGDEDSEVHVFEAGASDYLTKPFRARALSTRLQAVLGRKAIALT
ncbi:MAG: ATPase, T2SS/T4P/T4SS family [Gemmatimonadota bacterium]